MCIKPVGVIHQGYDSHMALHIGTRLLIIGPKMKQADMCCCGCCNISCGTDITVLWGQGFTTSFLLCDIHKPTPKFITTLSKTEIWCSLFFFFLKSCCSGFKVLPPFPIMLHSQASFTWYFVFVVSRCWLCCSELQISLNMVQRITTIIKDNQDRLWKMPYIPKTSFQQDSLGFSCDVNKTFLTFLFSDHAIGLQFLKDDGLICSNVQCNSCSRDDLVCRSLQEQWWSSD